MTIHKLSELIEQVLDENGLAVEDAEQGNETAIDYLVQEVNRRQKMNDSVDLLTKYSTETIEERLLNDHL